MTLEIIKDFLIPLLAVVIAAYLGYRLGKWSKYRELLFSKKIEVYYKLSEELVNFLEYCSPKENITFAQQVSAFEAYYKLNVTFFSAALIIPPKLNKDIKDKFNRTDKKIKNIGKFWNYVNILKNGKPELDISFEDFKKESKEIEKYFSSLPGPFKEFVESIPDIINMLKQDLGMHKLDNNFYKNIR